MFSIGYDFHLGNGDNGNVYGITNYKDTTHGRDQSFIYDPLNRLISAQNAGTNCSTMVLQNKTEYWGNSYGYDAWGNLINKTVTKCGAENLSVTADNHNWIHTTAPDYQYDAAGNMTYDATAGLSYTFDQENRITGANGYTYTYDGDGNRVRKSNGNLAANGTLYWYMTPGVVAESDLAGTTKSEYIFFDGERVARRDGVNGAGGVFYYFSDHLKTASVITDSAGTIKAESDYYPWGGELQFVANDSNDYKFTGKKRDTETGLDYFGARYYSNGLGRFITPDWAAKAAAVPYAEFADPQSLNLYSYVRNIPTTKYDPDGHCPGDTPNCQKMQNNPLSNVSQAVKQAVNDSVKASNSPTADDKKGGSHEEGFVAYTNNGTQTVAPAQPGPYKDVKQQGVAEIDPFKAANPAQAKPGNVQADVVEHVHPSAEVTDTKGPPQGGGTTTIGGTVTTTTSNFKQPPSATDISVAQPSPTINIVVGARDKTVYVYDNKGCTCKESLKDFNKEPQ